MSQDEKFRQIVGNSGNTFHSKVTSALQGAGWTALISPYYTDNLSDKPREVDLITERSYPALYPYGQDRGDIDVRLCIECKYVQRETVFWFHGKDMSRARQLVLDSTPMKDNNSVTDDHHYLSTDPRVAKLFSSGTGGSPDNDFIYKAINQAINAMIYFSNGQPIIPEAKRGRRPRLASLVYPVLVCNSFSSFRKLDIGTDGDMEEISGNFQLEVNYAYLDGAKRPRQGYFLIDVVEYGRLNEFFEGISSDVTAVGSFV